MRATRATIHLENLKYNIQNLKKYIGKNKKICMAVKADAYGHGAVRISKTALESGVEYLAVATVEEGIQLRNAGITAPLLLFSLPLPCEIKTILEKKLIPAAADQDSIITLETEAKKLKIQSPVHLKIDTGMGRIGCRPDHAAFLAELISNSSLLRLEGVFTHFPDADSKTTSFTLHQLDIFNKALDSIRKKGIDPGIIHTANSAAIINYPQSHFNMVRPGIYLYGYYPLKDQKKLLSVKPVMEFESCIVFLKKIKKGTPVSYGLTYKAPQDTEIATIPAGYGDGFNRLLSGCGRVWIKDKSYPIAGRICMDYCMVDLGPDSNVNLYDKAVLFGPDAGGVDAETVADTIGTIPYEVTCNINKRVPRVYID